VIQAQDFLPQKMDRVLLHHRRENNKIFIFYKKFVSFFFLVGVIATSLVSVNYWMIASYSWRRDLDLIVSKVSFGVFFVNGLIYSKLPFRIVVYPSTGLILGSYYISQKLFELNSSYWYKYHMMFHFFSCTNIMFILQSIK